MKLAYFVLFISLMAVSCNDESNDMIYICTDEEYETNTYHKDKTCKKLNDCQKDILYVPIFEKDKGRYLDKNDVGRYQCGLCYGK